MSELTDSPIKAYILHDPVLNIEGYITDYDKSALAESEGEGNVIIAEHADGSREIVHAEDVEEPKPTMNGVTLVQPIYVDLRMQAVCDVVDAIDDIISQPATASVMATKVATASGATESSDTTPIEAFHAALNALKELALNTDEGGADADA